MSKLNISEDIFGNVEDKKTGELKPVKLYRIQNENGVVISLISLGATIQSINVPDRNGDFKDVVLGFDSPAEYQGDQSPYFGCTVGRVANRIRHGRFTLNNQEYQLAVNANNAHLHGGFIGFDKVLWNSYISGNKVIFTYLSPDGEEFYPGDLLVTVTYQLTSQNKLYVTFEASTTKPTIVNLTNHSYFNLAGYDAGAKGLYEHDISINADRITELDDELLPTGNLLDVTETTLDLRKKVNLGKMITDRQNDGYDYNFCLNDSSFAAKVVHPPTGRSLEVHTTDPGVQFYTGNFLSNIRGKNGTQFDKHSGFCLETQKFPDGINIPSFPSIILLPGDQYKHKVIYSFGTIQN